MGQCCYCCLSEGDKVERIMRKFPAQGVAGALAADGAWGKFVGRVVLAGNQLFRTPAKGIPCVWFKIKVERQRIEHYTVQVDDGEGRSHSEQRTREVWDQIVNKEMFTDFWLQDGSVKLFVNGKNRGQCKIQSMKDRGANWAFWSTPPPGVMALVAQSGAAWTWGSTGKYRYTEKSFDLNELVAAIGMIAPAFNDPYTGQPCKALQPITAGVLTDEWMEANEWTDWDKRAWHDLLEKKGSNVLLSDDPEFTQGVVVQPINNLPAWMMAPMPTGAAAFQGMYGATAAPMAAPQAVAMAGQPMVAGAVAVPMQAANPMMMAGGAVPMAGGAVAVAQPMAMAQ